MEKVAEAADGFGGVTESLVSVALDCIATTSSAVPRAGPKSRCARQACAITRMPSRFELVQPLRAGRNPGPRA
jgi:hypothetical protein